MTDATPVVLTVEQLISIYKELKGKFTNEELFKIRKQINILKRNIKDQYILLLQMGVAILIYFYTLSNFGIILFIISQVLIISMIYVTIIFYRLLEILPFFLRRFNKEAESYINEFNKNN